MRILSGIILLGSICVRSMHVRCFIRGRLREGGQMHRKEDSVKTKAEMAVMWLQAKECRQPPAAGRGME